ncbi:MAG: hypothetical protein LBG72_04510 [Spirochaetaceae bacterium]|jgi:Zn-dependent peptidase ImmA (M78 family)|nr:hypothetical protein [Spirochaetaceae bacterium]
MDKEYIKKAANEFGAELSVAEKYGDYFFNKIKPKIKRKFLSHLISSVEDMINEKRKSANNINGLRLYSISLLPITLKKRATTRFFDNGAFIFYNDVYIGKQAQLLIAHELGHIVNGLVR